MIQKHKSSFRGKVGLDAKKTQKTSHGYLNLTNGIKQFSIEENAKKAIIDILPYVVTDPKHPNRDADAGIALKGDLWYRRPFKVHRDVGSLNESCICPKSVGKPCPICEYQKKQFDAGADKDETVALYPKERNLYIVVPKDSKKFEEVPHVWDMSQKLFQDMLKEAIDEDPENEVFPDLVEGKSLEISFKWKTFGKSTFPEARNIEFLDREEPYDEAILDEIPSLDEMFRVLSYEELSNKFFELDDETDGGSLEDVDTHEPEEEKVVERKSKTVAKTPAPATPTTPTWEELQNMALRNLLRICTRLNLDIDPEDYEDEETSLKQLRIAMAEALEIEIPKPKATRGSVESGPANRTSKVKEEAATPNRREKPQEEANRCPFKHKFGVDCEKFEDCDTCDLWNECLDAKEGN